MHIHHMAIAQLPNTDCLFLLTGSVGQRNGIILMNEYEEFISMLPQFVQI